jgi:DnaJ-class molecular chaperone
MNDNVYSKVCPYCDGDGDEGDCDGSDCHMCFGRGLIFIKKTLLYKCINFLISLFKF